MKRWVMWLKIAGLAQFCLEKLATTSVEVLAPARVATIKPLKNGMRLTLEDSEQILESSLVVIADGANSKTAQKIGIHSNQQPYGQQGIIANIALDKPHDGVAYERFTDQGPMAMLPLPDYQGRPRCALVWTEPAEKAEQLMAASDEEFLTMPARALWLSAGNAPASW